jgi:hypothetical protein
VKGVNLNDLPPALRREVEAKLGTSKRKRTTQVAIKGQFRGWCWACGTLFSVEREWERHVAATGHARLEMIAPSPAGGGV